MALKTNLLMLASLSNPVAFAATPGSLELQPGSSEVTFTAVGHPSLLRIKGEGAHATGAIEPTDGNYAGDVKVDLREFHTGISLRDKHMKEKYLELGKPDNELAVLHIAKLVQTGVESAAKNTENCAFSGTLTLHGKTQPVAGAARVSSSDAGARRFEAEWTIRLSDFNVMIPKFAGISVADLVEIRADAKMSRNTP